MRLKERVEALEARLEAMEIAIRIIGGAVGTYRLYESGEFEEEFVSDMTGRLRAAVGAKDDERWVEEAARALFDDVRDLLDPSASAEFKAKELDDD